MTDRVPIAEACEGSRAGSQCVGMASPDGHLHVRRPPDRVGVEAATLPPAGSRRAAAGHLGLGTAGGRQDDARGELPGGAPAAGPLVPGGQRRWDVATFFYYLGQAAPRRGRPLPLLTPEYRHGLASSPGASSASSTGDSGRRARSSSTTTRRCRATPRYRRSSGRRWMRFPRKDASSSSAGASRLRLLPAPRWADDRHPRLVRAPVHAGRGGRADPDAGPRAMVPGGDPRAPRIGRRLGGRPRAAARAGPRRGAGLEPEAAIDGSPVR